LPPSVLAPVALPDSSVAVVVADDEILSLDSAGKKRWSAKIPGGKIAGPPVPCPNGDLLVPTSAGAVGISAKGDINWSRDLSGAPQSFVFGIEGNGPARHLPGTGLLHTILPVGEMA
jgi:hypothetical protein